MYPWCRTDWLVHDTLALLLQGCAGRYEGNSVAGNGRGSITVDKLADVDLDILESNNQLDKPVTRL
jgi:hypothetical protein